MATGVLSFLRHSGSPGFGCRRFIKWFFTMTGLGISLPDTSDVVAGASVSRKIEPLAELREQIIAHGWNQKATGRVVSELLVHLAIALARIWILVAFDGLVVRNGMRIRDKT